MLLLKRIMLENARSILQQIGSFGAMLRRHCLCYFRMIQELMILLFE